MHAWTWNQTRKLGDRLRQRRHDVVLEEELLVAVSPSIGVHHHHPTSQLCRLAMLAGRSLSLLLDKLTVEVASPQVPICAVSFYHNLNACICHTHGVRTRVEAEIREIEGHNLVARCHGYLELVQCEMRCQYRVSAVPPRAV